MKHTFDLSLNRIGIIEYYEKTTFPNNEEFRFRQSKDEKEKDELLKTLCPIKPRINKIYFVAMDKTETEKSGFSESVYFIDSGDLFNMKRALEEVDKLFEGRTQTLEQHYEQYY